MIARKPRPPGAEAVRKFDVGALRVELMESIGKYAPLENPWYLYYTDDFEYSSGQREQRFSTKEAAWPTFVATVAALARLKVALAAAGWRDL